MNLRSTRPWLVALAVVALGGSVIYLTWPPGVRLAAEAARVVRPNALHRTERRTYDGRRVLESNLFASPTAQPAEEPNRRCGRDLRLVGILVHHRNEARSLALVRTAGGSGRLLRATDLAGPYEVTRITTDLVAVRAGEERCELRMAGHLAEAPDGAPRGPAEGPTDGIRQLGDDRFAVPRALVLDAVAGRMALRSRLFPTSRGVRLSGVRLGSPAAQLGLQDGDVLTRVGGRSTLDVEAMLDLAASLPTRETLDVEIERAGRTVRHSYELR